MAGLCAPSRPGISPRAAHRFGRDTLASSARATVEGYRSVRDGLLPSQMLRWPLRLMTTPFAPRHYTRFIATTSGPPSPAISTFASLVGAACAFPFNIAGQVLKFLRSQDESHASCTPDTAWLVSRCRHALLGTRECSILVSSNVFDASAEVRLRSSLSSIHDAINVAPFDHTFTTAAFDEAAHGSLKLLLQGGSEGHLHLSTAQRSPLS